MPRRPPLDYLQVCPKTARHWEHAEDGHVVLLVPKFDGKILGRYLQPRLKQPHFRLHLDKVGSAVWEACDGTRTGAELAVLLAARFPELKDVPGRVALFLRQLHGQGHVAA